MGWVSGSVDKANRATLLKGRFKALGGVPYHMALRNPKGQTNLLPNKGAGKPLAIFYGVACADRRPDWIGKVGGGSKLILKARKALGVSPLTTMAKRLNQKLPLVSIDP
jgi:hypothetical protein